MTSLRILMQYLSNQLCKIQRKNYTSAPWIGCSVEKSRAMKLVRLARSGGTSFLAALMAGGRSWDSEGEYRAMAKRAKPCEPSIWVQG